MLCARACQHVSLPGHSAYTSALGLRVESTNSIQQRGRAYMLSASDYNRICWASRRGMLELDLILGPFVANEFQQLNSEDQQRYIRLLEEEDNDLFAWFLGHQSPQDPDLQLIVAKVLAANSAR